MNQATQSKGLKLLPVRSFPDTVAHGALLRWPPARAAGWSCTSVTGRTHHWIFHMIGDATMETKREVLSYVGEYGPADSETVALALGFATRAGSAATLLRLHRHGHLNRYRSETGAYSYTLSEKGRQWLTWWSWQHRNDVG